MMEKSFYSLYQEAKNQPTAAQLFIARVAKLTHRSEMTVRMWLSGCQTPDDLAQSVIAKDFGVDEKTLFPKQP